MLSKYTTDWQNRDRVARLEVSREAALTRRNSRWAASKSQTTSLVPQSRREEVKSIGAASLIDKPSSPEQLISKQARPYK